MPAPLTPFPTERRIPQAAPDGSMPWGWRALHGGDLAWLATLYASTREEELRSVPWPAQARQQFLAQQFAAQHQHYLAQHPHAHYLAILCDGLPAGRFYVDENGEDDLIVDISLLPSWRGRGLGTAVIGCQQQASAARGRALRLHVMRHNAAAQRLYTRLGFVAVDVPASDVYLPMYWTPPVAPVS